MFVWAPEGCTKKGFFNFSQRSVKLFPSTLKERTCCLGRWERGELRRSQQVKLPGRKSSLSLDIVMIKMNFRLGKLRHEIYSSENSVSCAKGGKAEENSNFHLLPRYMKISIFPSAIRAILKTQLCQCLFLS
jgi:hypothetical protein